MNDDSRRDRRAAMAGLATVATLATGGLVLALSQVVQQAVQQGESRRAATAVNSAAFWGCHASQSRALRDSCLAQLDLPAAVPLDANAPSPEKRIATVDLVVPIRGR